MRIMQVALIVILVLLSSCSTNRESPNIVTQSATHSPLVDDTEVTQTSTASDIRIVELEPTSTKSPLEELSESRTYTDLEATIPEPRSTTDIPYIDDGDVRHKLDVHLPPTDANSYPVLLAIHGGAFSFNSKNLYRDLAPIYNEMGFAVVATNYRYISATSYPGQVEDVACALAWIHTEGENYGLDPSRVILMGGSAGGYLAAMLATHEDLNAFLNDCPHSLPQEDTHIGAVIFYGLTNFTNPVTLEIDKNRAVLEKLWGQTYEEISQERLAEMSPITWIDSSDKPFLMLHGTRDYDIPVEMTYEFVEALDEAGVRVETFYPYLSHAFEVGTFIKEDIRNAYLTVDLFIGSLIRE